MVFTLRSPAIEIVKSSLKIKKLKIVLILLSIYMGVEVLVGFYSGSLALLADAGHMLTDSFGVGIALIAAIYSRREATPIHTFGFFRTEILASLINSIILALLSIIITYEAYRRFFEPVEIQTLPMTMVAIAGLAVNIAGMYILRGEHVHDHHGGEDNDKKANTIPGHATNEHPDSPSNHTHSKKEKMEDLNLQGARLELLSDTIGSIGVIGAGIAISITKIQIIDPILSVGLAVFIFPRILTLLRKSVHILMEGVPSNISYEQVQQALLQIKGVTGVFDLHIWSLTSGLHSLSAHLVIMDTSSSYQILHEVNSLLEKHFNITHSTIQIEKFHPSDGDH